MIINIGGCWCLVPGVAGDRPGVSSPLVAAGHGVTGASHGDVVVAVASSGPPARAALWPRARHAGPVPATDRGGRPLGCSATVLPSAFGATL